MQTSLGNESETQVMALSFSRLRRSILLISVILAGTLVISIAPAVSSADEENDTQHIEQFQPIAVSGDMLGDFEAVAEDMDQVTMLMIFMQLQELGEIDTDLTEDSFTEAESLDEVKEHLDGDFLIPDELPDGMTESDARFGIGESGQVTATINVGVARTITELLDLPAKWLPEDTGDGETLEITLNIPESGLAGWHSGMDMLIVGQIGVPELDVPDEMDLELLRDAIIDDPRMPDELADQLDAIDNWDETVPVPVPEGADYEDLTIDGNPGFVLSMDNKGGVVAWADEGTLHFVAGNSGADELQEIAESMQ
ncbi:MAG: DUF4367 domain-containing protein [Thermomicrobiaceae bacterium]